MQYQHYIHLLMERRSLLVDVYHNPRLSLFSRHSPGIGVQSSRLRILLAHCAPLPCASPAGSCVNIGTRNRTRRTPDHRAPSTSHRSRRRLPHHVAGSAISSASLGIPGVRTPGTVRPPDARLVACDGEPRARRPTRANRPTRTLCPTGVQWIAQELL